ncbi:MAG: glycosyltransferase family 39 protein [Bacteroidales bacterium]|nr:glycosyltransferase family 39 protein [Bacteroidales bacterium]
MNKEALARILKDHKYKILFIGIGIIFFLYMFVDIMEIDAAQYALISMEMSITKSFLHVYQLGLDYLDKPPLLFWLSSLSFMILGVSNFAYKLPAILVAILGIYSTYRFAKLWYSRQTAVFAALILATSQAMFLMVNDIRTDVILLGFTMFAFWQLSEYLEKRKWLNLILSAVGIGGAMLAKGPLGIMIPALAFGSEFILKRQWKNILKYQWLVLLVIVAIILLPMCYGLYTQFDMHPEKVVYGLKGPSGIDFYFWTQSFGRITGQNYWKNSAGYFYFFHTILWDFQPWIFLFIPALLLKLGKIIYQKFKGSSSEEYITLAGFVLPFIAFSFSRYKLPHYLYVLFPFASIITADFIVRVKDHWKQILGKVQFGIIHFFWLLIIVGLLFVFPPKNFLLPLGLLLLYIIFIFAFRKIKEPGEKIIIPTVIAAVAFNLLLAVNFYPNLLKYQAGSQAGHYVVENNIPVSKIVQLDNPSFSFDFYSRDIAPPDTTLNNLKKGDWLFVDETELARVKAHQLKFEVVKEFPSFRVTGLNKTFLYRKTRNQSLKKRYIIKLQ